MRNSVSLQKIKQSKKGKLLCPSCGSKTEDSTYSEEGEEIEIKKCTKSGCFWWGGI